MSVESVMAELEKKTAQRLAAIALDLHAEARLNATGRNGGPNVDTGNLRNSIVAQQTGPLEWQVGVVGSPNPVSGVKASEYGKHLEFGTRLMPAKPFMRPAIEAVKVKYRRA